MLPRPALVLLLLLLPLEDVPALGLPPLALALAPSPLMAALAARPLADGVPLPARARNGEPGTNATDNAPPPMAAWPPAS